MTGMSDPNLNIEDLARALNSRLLEKRGATMPFSWEQLAGPRRDGHYVTTIKTPEWLAERDVFVEKWKALEEEGIRQGFLDYGMCFECAGTVEATTNTEDRVWVWDEGDVK